MLQELTKQRENLIALAREYNKKSGRKPVDHQDVMKAIKEVKKEKPKKDKRIWTASRRKKFMATMKKKRAEAKDE